MKGIDTGKAVASHDPYATLGCATDICDRPDSTPTSLSKRLREACLAHSDRVPDCVGTADNVWDTDHRCAETCVADISGRILR